MGEPEQTWTTLGRRVSHQGRVRLVEHTVVLADGSEARYEVDESIPFAVATLVVDGDVSCSPVSTDTPSGVGSTTCLLELDKQASRHSRPRFESSRRRPGL